MYCGNTDRQNLEMSARLEGHIRWGVPMGTAAEGGQLPLGVPTVILGHPSNQFRRIRAQFRLNTSRITRHRIAMQQCSSSESFVDPLRPRKPASSTASKVTGTLIITIVAARSRLISEFRAFCPLLSPSFPLPVALLLQWPGSGNTPVENCHHEPFSSRSPLLGLPHRPSARGANFMHVMSHHEPPC